MVFCCATTSAVPIKTMEDYASQSFIQSFIRFSCEVGYPKVLLTDEGSQLVKSVQSMKLNINDIKSNLHSTVDVDFEVCPVGGHNMHGRVERKIQEIKKSIENILSKERLSVLQWETVASIIGNSINDLPLALGNVVSNFETMDLLTPNRLKLGRNNSRSPLGNAIITTDFQQMLETNKTIFNSWFENWLMHHVPKLINKPKWFETSYHLKEGDIVLFLKHDSVLSSTYQYGMVKSVETGKDGIIRKANIRYRNFNEHFDRETFRSVRQLVMIHPIDELNLTQELGEVARTADYHYSRAIDGPGMINDDEM